jgi:putative Mn2+ efflux pump MntP
MLARTLNLLSVAFFLSLDNFRTSVILGPLRLRVGRVLLVAAWFGLWDGVAPLLGLLFGNYVGDRIGAVSDYIGPLALGLFGVFLLLQSWRHWNNEPEVMEESWTILGLPLPLSVDNFVGGASLGLLGFTPWFSALVFALTTFVMSLIGLYLGRGLARLFRLNIRYELITGIGLVIEAIVLGVLATQGAD